MAASTKVEGEARPVAVIVVPAVPTAIPPIAAVVDLFSRRGALLRGCIAGQRADGAACTGMASTPSARAPAAETSQWDILICTLLVDHKARAGRPAKLPTITRERLLGCLRMPGMFENKTRRGRICSVDRKGMQVDLRMQIQSRSRVRCCDRHRRAPSLRAALYLQARSTVRSASGTGCQ